MEKKEEEEEEQKKTETYPFKMKRAAVHTQILKAKPCRTQHRPANERASFGQHDIIRSQ